MDDLIAFLNTRLDEDERLAKAIPVMDWNQQDWAELDGAIDQHVQNHDPARVLADVAAKRQIIEEHEPIHEVDWHGEPALNPCGTLRRRSLAMSNPAPARPAVRRPPRLPRGVAPVITKRECHRRAAKLRDKAQSMLNEADRGDDDLTAWRLRDDARCEFRRADKWQRLADGSMWSRWIWSELSRPSFVGDTNP